MRVSKAKHQTLLFFIITSIFVFTDMTDAQEIGLFRLRRWNGSMLFRMQRHNKIEPFNSNKNGYSGKLIIRNSGFVINPEVLNFELRGDVGLYLQQLITQDVNRNTRGRLLGHSFIASLFKSNTNSFIFFWNHNTNIITIEDNGRTGYDVNTLKGIVNMQGAKFPSRLQVELRDVSESWDRVGFKTKREQLRRSIQYDGKHEGENSIIEVDYDFKEVKDRDRNNSIFNIDYDFGDAHAGDSTITSKTRRSYSRHTLNIRRHYIFGKNETNLWDSRIYLYMRHGLGNYKNGMFNQSLFFQHFSSLSSQYNHSLAVSHTKGVGTSFQNSAFASLNHSLYASLNSNLGLSSTYSKFRDGKVYNYSVNGGINYSKKIPLSGNIHLSYTHGYSINDNQIEKTEKVVISERHVFIGSLPVMLNERNIILSTIYIHDKGSELLFEEGDDKDYIVKGIGDRVEIHRNIFGRIRDGEEILVDYHFESLPAMRFSTNSRVFNAGLHFGWVAFNYVINRHAQKLLAGDPIYTSSLQDLFTKALQMKIRLRSNSAGLSITAEQRFYKSKKLDYKSVNARYSAFVRPLSSITLSSDLTLSLFYHNQKDIETKVYALRSQLNWHPSRSFIFQAYVNYRTRKESLQPDENSFEYGGFVQRYWRVLRVLFRYEKRKWEIDPQLVNERRFTFEVQRIF